MAKDLFIDIETYSSVDIKTCGAYKYIASPDFEILIVGYAFDDGPVTIVDLAQGEELPEEFEEALFDESIRKHAHNATFERNSFKRIGYDVPTDNWYCSLVKSAYCGLPLGLDQLSKVLDIKDKKLDTGKALIKFFSCPCKPTKTNGMRTRNMPWDAPEKWELYKEYNKYDVLSEREIYRLLEQYEIPTFERQLYILDQKINDRGILIDKELAQAAIDVDAIYTEMLMQQSKNITHLENPNSVAQLKKWYGIYKAKFVNDNLSDKDKAYLATANGQFYDCENQSMAADAIKMLLKLDAVHKDKELVTVLENRQKLGRSSVKKYYTMINCAMADDRVRGTFQFYGANRTGRWAGRLVQLQNLSKNHFEFEDIKRTRELIRKRDWEAVEMLYGDVSDVLSQLVRPTFIAPKGMMYCVADFSAIEARVVSWLANEEWRMEVFRGDGKIYEAAGARMFNVPIEAITKGSDLRAKAKNAELALGYEGALGAMKRMGGDKMGMSDAEMMHIVKLWRDSNPNIVSLWREIEKCAHEAVRYQREVIGTPRNLKFNCNGDYLMITLPSDRALYYYHPVFKSKTVGRKTVSTLFYEGMNQETKAWGQVDTYGGKLTENIVQAISRDLIGYAMRNLEAAGCGITMHVHDEAIAEIPEENAEHWLDEMIRIMSIAPSWASDLPLNAAGFTAKFYMKD